jgi:hypothetical protein
MIRASSQPVPDASSLPLSSPRVEPNEVREDANASAQTTPSEQIAPPPSSDSLFVSKKATAKKAPKKRKASAKSRELLETQTESQEMQDAFPTEEALLERLGQGAEYCRKIEDQLSKYAGPELNAIMRLHRIIILKLSTQAELNPALWAVLKDLLKPGMDWARLQEQQKDREFAERKHHDQMAADQTEATVPKDPAETSLTPETLEKIEFELKLL